LQLLLGEVLDLVDGGRDDGRLARLYGHKLIKMMSSIPAIDYLPAGWADLPVLVNKLKEERDRRW